MTTIQLRKNNSSNCSKAMFKSHIVSLVGTSHRSEACHVDKKWYIMNPQLVLLFRVHALGAKARCFWCIGLKTRSMEVNPIKVFPKEGWESKGWCWVWGRTERVEQREGKSVDAWQTVVGEKTKQKSYNQSTWHQRYSEYIFKVIKQLNWSSWRREKKKQGFNIREALPNLLFLSFFRVARTLVERKKKNKCLISNSWKWYV